MNNKIIKETSNKLHHIAAKYISGEIDSLEETQSAKNKVFVSLVKECKILKESLENQDIEKISKSLKNKERLAKEFYNLTCIKWRL